MALLTLEQWQPQVQDAIKASLKSKRRSIFSSSKGSKLNSDKNGEQPRYFLAPQNGFLTGTISFASADEKAKVVEEAQSFKPWELDDRFDGLTALYAGDEIDIEYVIFLLQRQPA